MTKPARTRVLHLASLTVAVLATGAGCIFFATDFPCEADTNCPADSYCGADGQYGVH